MRYLASINLYRIGLSVGRFLVIPCGCGYVNGSRYAHGPA